MNKRLKKKMKAKGLSGSKMQLKGKVVRQRKEIEALEEALKKAYISHEEKVQIIENVRAANKSLYKKVEEATEENRILEIEKEETLKSLKAQKYYIFELEQEQKTTKCEVVELREELFKYRAIPKMIKKLYVKQELKENQQHKRLYK